VHDNRSAMSGDRASPTGVVDVEAVAAPGPSAAASPTHGSPPCADSDTAPMGDEPPSDMPRRGTSPTPTALDDDAQMVLFSPKEGYRAVCLRYSKIENWRSTTLWLHPDAHSDDVKWQVQKWVGSNVSEFRLHSGYSGTPYDRKTPLSVLPHQNTPVEELPPQVIVAAPSFGP
jgi:hypothetical protein